MNIYKADQESIMQSSVAKVNKRSICELNFYFKISNNENASVTQAKENAKYLFSHVEGSSQDNYPNLENLA